MSFPFILSTELKTLSNIYLALSIASASNSPSYYLSNCFVSEPDILKNVHG